MIRPHDERFFAMNDPWPEGRNLLRYDRKRCVLSDHHSPVAVGAWNSDAMGVTPVYLQGWVPAANRPVLDPLLRFFVGRGEAWEPVPVRERTCWPGGWREEAQAGEMHITQHVWFSAHNRLRVGLELSAASATAVRLAAAGGHANSGLLLQGKTDADGIKVELRDRAGTGQAAVNVQAEPQWASCRFRRGASQHSLAPRPETLTDSTEPDTAFGYWIEWPALEVGPDAATLTLVFTWTFGDEPASEQDEADFPATIERWRNMLTSMPLPEGHYWRRKAMVAVADLWTLLIESPGYGNLTRKLSVGACSLDHLSASYFWDAMSTVSALARLEPDWAAQVIESFTRFIGLHDCPPFAIPGFPRIDQKRKWRGSQAPIASWAVQKYHDCAGGPSLTERLYPELKKINDSWYEHADPDGEGIPVWANSGASFDSSPLYDQYAGSPPGTWPHIYLPAIASVNLMSYLLMDLKILRSMATELGRHEEAAAWQARHEDMDRKILELLWHPDEKIFYDLDLTAYRPTRVKTFFNLLPLWAGVSLPEAEARAAIEAHLLNPEEFWGDIPFPSAAYNDPTFDPLGYCRGRGWPHIYFWNTEILAKYGYVDEANEAKRRYLAVLADTIDIPENFVGSLLVEDRRDHGLPHYSWGDAATLYFLWDWHLQPL
jgi:hypothetical protein